MIRAVKVTQRSKEVHFSGSWKVSDIQEAVKSFSK
jgi:hypothetical protein